MTPRPDLLSQYLCRVCGERIRWAILRVLRVDPDTPGFMPNESYCHESCLSGVVRPAVELAFHRHWAGRVPVPDDSADIDGNLVILLDFRGAFHFPTRRLRA